MQVILVQAEIEQALRNYVNEMISVKEGMEITVDLKATRGADGATAVVDIVPAKEKPVTAVAVASIATPVKVTPRGGINFAAKAKAEEKELPEAKAEQLTKVEVADDKSPEVDPELEPEVVEVPAQEAEAGAASAESAAEEESATVVPAKKQLFQNLRKPNNAASE